MDKKKIILIIIIFILFTAAVSAGSIAIYKAQAKRETEKKIEDLMDKVSNLHIENKVVEQNTEKDDNTSTVKENDEKSGNLIKDVLSTEKYEGLQNFISNIQSMEN